MDANDDSDGDGSCDSDDPCPNDPNDDEDGDGVCGDVDPCPVDANDDSDGDGSCDSDDPCPNDANDDEDGDGEAAASLSSWLRCSKNPSIQDRKDIQELLQKLLQGVLSVLDL